MTLSFGEIGVEVFLFSPSMATIYYSREGIRCLRSNVLQSDVEKDEKELPLEVVSFAT